MVSAFRQLADVRRMLLFTHALSGFPRWEENNTETCILRGIDRMPERPETGMLESPVGWTSDRYTSVIVCGLKVRVHLVQVQKHASHVDSSHVALEPVEESPPFLRVETPAHVFVNEIECRCFSSNQSEHKNHEPTRTNVDTHQKYQAWT